MKKVIALLVEDKDTGEIVAKMYKYKQAAINSGIILKTSHPKKLRVNLFIDGQWVKIKKDPKHVEKIFGKKADEIPFIDQDFYSL